MKMRILLIGCTGFIGKELIPKLIEEGHSLCIISRKNIDKLKFKVELKKIIFLKLDLSIEQNWRNKNLHQNLKNADGIINLIGEPIADKRWTDQQKQKIFTSRVNTTFFLMKTIKTLSLKPKVIINGSAIGYYGTSIKKEFNEKSNKGNDFLAHLCEKWEAAANQKPFFTRLVILRIGIVIESDGGALGKMLPIFKLGLGGPIGDGKQWMSWIHRTDLCGLIICAIKNKNFSGVYNAVSPEPTTMDNFSNILANCLNKPNSIPVPSIPLKLLIGEGAKLVLEGQKVLSIKITKNLYKFKYPLLEKALFAATKK